LRCKDQSSREIINEGWDIEDHPFGILLARNVIQPIYSKGGGICEGTEWQSWESYNNGKFIAIGWDGRIDSPTGIVYSSDDGINWSELKSSTNELYSSADGVGWNEVTQ
jgi:hypothetical protein